MAIGILAILLVVFYIVWAIAQFTGPGRLAQFALLFWVGLATLILSGVSLEA